MKEPLGSPGANMTTNVLPPRVEIHLKEKTVMEVLNAISEWTLARASAGDLALPQGVTLWPQGWKSDVLPAHLSPLNGWSRSIFSAFP